jgi:hypothetical protein
MVRLRRTLVVLEATVYSSFLKFMLARVVTIGRREAQAKRAVKKGDKGGIVQENCQEASCTWFWSRNHKAPKNRGFCHFRSHVFEPQRVR